MNKKILILSILILAGSCAFSAPNFQYSQNPVQTPQPLFEQDKYTLPTQQTISGDQTLKGRVVTVPAGQAISAVVTAPISSANTTNSFPTTESSCTHPRTPSGCTPVHSFE